MVFRIRAEAHQVSIRFVGRSVLLLLASVTVLFIPLSVSFALPFNDDMVQDQIHTGQLMRSAPSGSVPLGSETRLIQDRAEAESLTNPLTGDPLSASRGERLWEVNCVPCHGVFQKGAFESAIPKEAWSLGIAGPNLTQEMYKQRSDGNILGTIYFGSLSGLMPRYSWKLSIDDHWDLVNYVRSMQAETE